MDRSRFIQKLRVELMRKTQDSRATHDPRPATQEARPTTHLLYPRDLVILKEKHLLNLIYFPLNHRKR